MNPLRADFDELYRRHLCRHSQYGINVWHLVAVVGVYISLLGLLRAAPGGAFCIGGALVAYFLVIAWSIPRRLLLTTIVFVGGLLALFALLPETSFWVYAIFLLVWHRFQVWQHRVYDHAQDMRDFAEKYPRGMRLFLLLAIYELPLLLHYLIFDAQERRAAQDGGRELPISVGSLQSANSASSDGPR